MGKIVASVRNGRSIGSGAATLTDDIKFGFVAHSLNVDVFGFLAASQGGTTLLGVVNNLDQLRIETTTSQPESTIDGDDLFDFDPSVGIPQWSTDNTLTVDGQPKAFAVTYPFTPFPMDDTRNYGLIPNRGVQTAIDFTADATIDGKTYDMTVEGLSIDSQKGSLGYIKFIRDAFSAGAAGEERFTSVQGNRILGVMNFQTTEFDAIAANAANNLTGIRQQALLFSNNIVLGPYKSFRSGHQNPFNPSSRNLLDTDVTGTTAGQLIEKGNFFSDYGIHNTGKIGIDLTQAGTQTVQVRTTAGVAEPLRVNPVVLVQ